MQVTDEMVSAAARAIYERHLAKGMLERADVEISDDDREWWMREFEADARVALAAVIPTSQG